MQERNNCLEKLKKIMLEKLISERENNRDRYLETIRNCILQSMIKLIEPELEIKCREEDVDDIKSMIGGLEDEYHNFMLEKTERDEYNCSLSVLEGSYITDDFDKGAGGVILFTPNKRIVCPNTLLARLHLVFEEFLPQIRENLFPK